LQKVKNIKKSLLPSRLDSLQSKLKGGNSIVCRKLKSDVCELGDNNDRALSVAAAPRALSVTLVSRANAGNEIGDNSGEVIAEGLGAGIALCIDPQDRSLPYVNSNG